MITTSLGFNGASGMFYEKIKPEALDYDAEKLAVLSEGSNRLENRDNRGLKSRGRGPVLKGPI